MTFEDNFNKFVNEGDWNAAAEILYEEGGYFVTSLNDIKDFIKEQIDEEDFVFAKHLLDAIIEEPDCDFWHYDYTMGTLETPSPIIDMDDVLYAYNG